MVSEISTLGSCSSRNIFNSDINKDYKNFFHVNKSIESISFISLMSSPIQFNESLINSKNCYDNECVINDLTKKFLLFLKEDKIDYLIIDTYFDVLYDIIIISENSFVTYSERLIETDLSKIFENKKRISISKNFYEYYQLWKTAINLFFKFMEENCKNTKIILNCSRSVFKYYDGEKIVEDEKLKKFAEINKYRDILDKYILENFDVDILTFDENTLASKQHIFGLHPTHYESKYYTEKNKQLNAIIERDTKLDYSDKINVTFRKLQRDYAILKMKYKTHTGNLGELFNKYLTARIDIKNENTVNNSIEITNNSDQNANISFPSWFENEFGKGVIINTQKRIINLKIKCIYNGNLIIKFRGQDITHNGIRIPAYINYNSIYINSEKINEVDKLTCHDKPFIYTKKVKNSEIIKIDIYWNPV